MTADHRPRSSYALIGYGRIGRRIATHVMAMADAPDLLAVLVSSENAPEAIAQLGEERVTTSLDAMLARRPDIVVECASGDALAVFGPAVLQSGADLIPLSLAALADREIEATLLGAAAVGPGRLELAAGAAGSLDIIAAAREDGIQSLVFRAIYPTARWCGTPAESMIDLGSVTSRTCFLTTSAREAVALFPRHINVAAGVALAGLGLDATTVELAADPDLTQAIFEIEMMAGPGPVFLRVEGRDAPLGADPVDYTAFSIIRLLRRRTATVRI